MNIIFKLIRNQRNKLRTNVNLYLDVHHYEKRERNILNGISTKDMKFVDADKHYNYWKPLLKFPTPYAFNLYGYFCNYDYRVVSQTIINKINDLLNPKRSIGFISDKNNFDKYLGTDYFPRTIARKIDWGGV